MAFSAVFPGAVVHFKPLSASRRETNSSGQRIQTKNTKPRKLKSRNFQPPPPYLPSTVEGGDATTFTRLPPIDDFGFDSLASQSVSEVIKLAECKPPSSKPKKSDQGIGKRNGSVSRIGVSEEKLGLDDELDDDSDDEGEDEAIDGSIVKKVGFGNGKFELFQVGSDDEDEDEAIDGSRVKKVGYEQGRFELYQVGSDDEDEDEDEDDDEDEKDLDGEEGLMAFGDEEEEGAKEKEKGVPAVMRCFDRAKIFVKAGDGGNGVVAFRREKYVPLGGPSGGDGGRGGNVYMEVDRAMNSLLPFRKSIHFRGGRGSHGQGQQKNGAKGEDVVIKVPPGTVVRKSEGDVLFELLYPGQKALLLPGGRGGRGNAAFKSGSNKAPKIAENGEEGLELWLELELKLVADVGIVGVPNAGKSTLLSVISAAQPAIANYPFTTLLPNLGVVSFGYDTSMVVADLPGLLEGAHRGFGLGYEFLRHTERCSVLVHIVDGSSEQPEYEFDAVRLELEMFSPELCDKPYIVAYNKMDLPEASEKWPSFREALQARGFEPFCMSAVTGKGTQEVTNAAYALVQKNKADEEEMEGPSDLNYMADMMKKQRAAPISEFEISHDSGTSTWHVEGVGLQRFVQMTNWRYMDSDRRFQGVLEACGVNKSLTKLGVKEGDTVVVGGMELVWYAAGPETGHTSRRKGAAQSSE